MTEPLDVQILDAFMTRLTSPALSGSPPIASPLVDYAPVTGTAYLDARPVMRAEPYQPGLSFAADVIHTGVFQVDAVVPRGQGEASGLRLAALVAERFAAGTALTVSAFRLKVLRPPSIASAVNDDPWVRYPVSVFYYLSTR